MVFTKGIHCNDYMTFTKNIMQPELERPRKVICVNIFIHVFIHVHKILDFSNKSNNSGKFLVKYFTKCEVDYKYI